jgi:hypothetical protein
MSSSTIWRIAFFPPLAPRAAVRRIGTAADPVLGLLFSRGLDAGPESIRAELVAPQDNEEATRRECPLWVISRHYGPFASCPLYPIADIRQRRWDVCFVPQADIAASDALISSVESDSYVA